VGTFRGRNSIKHHGKCFKQNTYDYLSKTKDEKASKKNIKRDKNLNDSLYLIFLT
jgi:hypothetical protein